MGRQPYLSLGPTPTSMDYQIGTQIARKRPELEALIGACLMAWPTIEVEMALVLGHLLGAKDTAALAVFQILRRSSNQRDAISAAAEASLNPADKELVTAVLNIHKSIEAERNALAHGHYGFTKHLPHHILWMDSRDYLQMQVDMALKPGASWSADKNDKFLSQLWVYKKEDLQTIHTDIMEMGFRWFELLKYLRRSPTKDARVRAAAYRKLCAQVRISQELEKLRHEKKPPVRHGSLPTGGS
jgi:hypothetical protein